VDRGVVTDGGFAADPDRADVAPQDHAGPDVGVGLDGHVADDGGLAADVCVPVDVRARPFEGVLAVVHSRAVGFPRQNS
jgi:hypothetical protein